MNETHKTFYILHATFYFHIVYIQKTKTEIIPLIPNYKVPKHNTLRRTKKVSKSVLEKLKMFILETYVKLVF